MARDASQETTRLRRQLRAFVAQAQENERKLQRFLQQELQFISADGLPTLLQRLFHDYPQRFELDAVSLQLFDADHEIRRILQDQALLPDSRLRFSDDPLPAGTLPCLGPIDTGQARELFPDNPAPVASAALLPLYRQDRGIGQLAIGSRHPERFIRGAATDFMERLAAILAVCIENALNHERLKRLGLLDPLTGVHNRRYFDARLTETVGQARRTGTPLACLFIDLDRFKQVNDTHGHATGDRVLQTVAEVLKNQMRIGDVLARLGGEEFAVLLTDTDETTAMDIAERIRATVARTPCPVDGRRQLHVTVSIGCSVLPTATDHSEAGQHLLQQADAALYAAKDAGRNRVVYRPF